MDKAIKLRPVTAKDESFLKRVYAQSREPEMQSSGWSVSQQKGFLDSQYTLRAMSHATQYPRAEHQIILLKSRRIGTLLHQIESAQLNLIDIALIKTERGNGIGSQVIISLCEKAQTLSMPVHLFVQADNLSAMKLYEKLSFTRSRITGSHYEMIWVPKS